ncbi:MULTISPECIES: carboxymuconolactone decarboxylase family protein [Aeromonas]|uniref:carboxymuconolactone decarboxylase family protein n=1 Tax=Aeromonas TaxID=642 RepID=UPI0012F159E0|nr:carboxymuconolactone decarboxylase family protein [Aeromonas salmonicida]VXA79915.1 Alkyl hydroperoxide reductase AhpD [Aeromonas salmonicida]
MKHYKEINKEQHQLGSAYRKSSPDTMNAFIALHKSVMKDDKVLALKYREMIALGIGIASRCDGCIASRCDGCIAAHVAGALQAGASREELVATIDVAVLMGGWPSIIYGTQAHAAIEELLS